MEFRVATVDDTPQLVRIRKQQLLDEGIAPVTSIDETLPEYFHIKLADGSLVEWLAVDEGQIVATAALLFLELPPTYNNVLGVRGYVTNMYTAPTHRGQGLATQLLSHLMDEARSRGVSKIFLGASKLGKPVYQRFGFKQSDKWMELDL